MHIVRIPDFRLSAEHDPLLSDTGDEGYGNTSTSPTFAERVGAVAQEPLTPLTQILLVLVLILLLTTSVCSVIVTVALNSTCMMPDLCWAIRWFTTSLEIGKRRSKAKPNVYSYCHQYCDNDNYIELHIHCDVNNLF